MNVTRHGLGTGKAEAIRQLAGLVPIVPLDETGDEAESQQLSPDELARKISEP